MVNYMINTITIENLKILDKILNDEKEFVEFYANHFSIKIEYATDKFRDIASKTISDMSNIDIKIGEDVDVSDILKMIEYEFLQKMNEHATIINLFNLRKKSKNQEN